MRLVQRRPLFSLLPLGILLGVLLGCDQGVVTPMQSGPNGTTQPAVNRPTTAPSLSAAPTAQSVPPTSAPPAQSGAIDPTIGLYSRAVADLVSRSDQHAYAVIYISPRLGRGQELNTDESSPATPKSLLTALHSLPNGNGGTASVQFATFAGVTGPAEEGSVVQNGGAFVTLGEIVYSDTNGSSSAQFTAGAVSATLRGSIYQSRADAVGVIYQFAIVGPAWQMQTATEEWRAQGVG